MTTEFIQHYRNAKVCIAQMRRGEWLPRWNPISHTYITAWRSGHELWIGSGGWFVQIDGTDYFGLLFRHWVWWAGARRLHSTKPPKPEPKLIPVWSDEA